MLKQIMLPPYPPPCAMFQRMHIALLRQAFRAVRSEGEGSGEKGAGALASSPAAFALPPSSAEVT